ncbi:cation/H(+) antiporter 2-like [Hibiscus syriacus]|uniref:cation/H(+) antiporter 2-like n=1 Tax=Hibiscus syriacus TaxID=106335 RepID=UPI001923DF45|nr:cation/H(+) antiporter 2-like [Hibiscus syriacus]
MEGKENLMCQSGDSFNPWVTSSFQVSCILVTSHFFHILLKPLGQPGPFAQLLAGVVVGPTLLSRISKVKDFFIQASSAEYYTFFSFLCRMLFMFSIGLETDIPYLKRNFRVVSIVAGGGLFLSFVFAGPLLWLLIKVFRVVDYRLTFYLLIFTVLANSASPVVFRMIAETKSDTADLGRLAIYASLLNEMFCVVIVAMLTACTTNRNFKTALVVTFVTVTIIFLNKYLSLFFNKRNRHNRFVTNSEIFIIMFLLTSVSAFLETTGFTSITCCFLVGLTFPRECKTYRTLLHKLTYAVNTFILPVYFGYAGFQFNISSVFNNLTLVLSVIIIVLCAGTRIAGTLAACYYLKIPRNESLILSLLLNMKGNYDLILINTPPVPGKLWEGDIHDLFVSVVILNTLIIAPVVAVLLNRDECFSHHPTTLEILNPESELRVLACVYIPRHVSGHVSLISALSGCQKAPIKPYLVHLVELPKKRKSKLMYHQLEDGDQYSDEEDYGGNDVVEISDALDPFISETKILVHQSKIVSSLLTIDQDVCEGAKELRVSIIFLPFHKHQRIDGKMENSMEEIRTINHKVIRDAPCSVGIFIDRGQTGFQQPHGSPTVQNIATFFFGGPDDREALACSKRMLMHSQVNLTVFRFIQTNTRQNSWINNASQKDEEVIMAISTAGAENEIDNAFVDTFYNRYVAQGKASLVEKHVSNGAETLEALREILDEMYSLVIVGKGGRRNCPLTTGLSDWEECPELGSVGDLLASAEMNMNGSLLVIQRHRHSETEDNFITP